jgi:hypothetical protein
MTTEHTPQSLFWVTCSITIECATVELWATGEHDASTQAEALFQKDPERFLRHMVARTSFQADYAPLNADGG